MRPGVAWHGSQAALFEEAMRVVPAVARHRAAGKALDVAATYRAYLLTAHELDVDTSTAWAVLASAFSVWTQNLFHLLAEASGEDLGEVISSAVSAAADWNVAL